MRICKQCQEPMEEGFILKVNTYGVPKLEKGAPSKPNGIRAARCPRCGEISLYISQNK